MQELRAPTGTGGARYALAAVGVALFGLLSMHGWGSHTGTHSLGVTPHGVDVTMASSTVGTLGNYASTASESAVSEQIVAVDPAGKDSEDPDRESGAGLLGLCLAVLAGLLLGIALLLARPRIRIPRTLLPGWRSPVFIGRDRDPPSLRMLCVIRC